MGCPQGLKGGKENTHRLEEVKVLDDGGCLDDVLHVDSCSGQHGVLGSDTVLLLAEKKPQLGGIVREIPNFREKVIGGAGSDWCPSGSGVAAPHNPQGRAAIVQDT